MILVRPEIHSYSYGLPKSLHSSILGPKSLQSFLKLEQRQVVAIAWPRQHRGSPKVMSINSFQGIFANLGSPGGGAQRGGRIFGLGDRLAYRMPLGLV